MTATNLAIITLTCRKSNVDKHNTYISEVLRSFYLICIHLLLNLLNIQCYTLCSLNQSLLLRPESFPFLWWQFCQPFIVYGIWEKWIQSKLPLMNAVATDRDACNTSPLHKNASILLYDINMCCFMSFTYHCKSLKRGKPAGMLQTKNV